MRVLLVVAGVLVLLAGLTLFVLPLRTGEWFAWTINPPMTAVFLGASYWAAAAIEWTAASRRRWADARIAVPGVLLFTTLTLVVTLVHLDKFHFDGQFPGHTRAITWAWLAIYAAVPVLLALTWWRQSREPGDDPPRTARLSGPVRMTALAQAIVLIPLGTGLLLAPATVSAWWPWELTPLTGRSVGAWLVSLGVVAVHVLIEDDVQRIRPAAVGALVLVVLHVVALVRHWGDLTGGAATIPSLAVVASFAVIGSTAFFHTGDHDRVAVPTEESETTASGT